MKFKLSLFSVALLAFAFGSACAAYAAPPTDACSLLTPAQVGAVLGPKVAAGKALMAKACVWRGAPGKGVNLILIDLQAFAAAKMPIGHGIVKTEVTGIVGST